MGRVVSCLLSLVNGISDNQLTINLAFLFRPCCIERSRLVIGVSFKTISKDQKQIPYEYRGERPFKVKRPTF